MADRLEFYDGDSFVAAVESSMAPHCGQYISIQGETWLIRAMTFALDDAITPSLRSMRCNINIEKQKSRKGKGGGNG